MLDAERSVEPNLQHAHLLAALGEIFDSLVSYLGSRAHHDDHMLCVGRSHVIEEVVGAANQVRETVHCSLDDVGDRQVVGIDRFPRLEEYIRVLSRATDDRSFRAQSTLAMRKDQLVIDHAANIAIGQLFDLADLVTGPETVKEMNERHACL